MQVSIIEWGGSFRLEESNISGEWLMESIIMWQRFAILSYYYIYYILYMYNRYSEGHNQRVPKVQFLSDFAQFSLEVFERHLSKSPANDVIKYLKKHQKNAKILFFCLKSTTLQDKTFLFQLPGTWKFR